ncbi:hypothetical protein FRC11_014153, partial [Ceratobasidium sp. 423]
MLATKDTSTSQADTQSALQSVIQLVQEPVAQNAGPSKETSATNPEITPATTPAIISAPNPGTKSVAQPMTQPITKSVVARRPAPYPLHRPTQHRQSSPSASSPESNPELTRPLMQLKYMKRPKGTPGRKGKNGWPAPMRTIFGTTKAQYLFIFTYKLIPEFKIYNADWPIRAFIQVILKSSSDTHRKLSRSVKLGQDDSMEGQEAIDMDNASMDGELAEDAYED